MTLRSRIYQGEVMHARLLPARHVFHYPVLFFGFDLDELDSLNGFGRLMGYNRRAIISLRDADHLSGAGGIKERALRLFAERGYATGIRRIELITCARCLGHAFNPVKFYYGFDERDALHAVIAEVSNTFGERHVYVLGHHETPRAGFIARFESQKAFHVSPFNDRSGHYTFDFSATEPAIDVRIDLWREGAEVIKTRLAGTAIPLTRANLRSIVWRYAFSIFKTLPRIHWQAACLYFGKKLRIFGKPVPMSDDTRQIKRPSWPQRLCMRLVVPHLRNVQTGHLRLLLPDGSPMDFGTPGVEPSVSVRIRDYRFFTRIVRDGEIGFGESYMYGEWDTEDVARLIELFLLNRRVFEEQESRQAWIGKVINRLIHRARANTVEGSRRNIEAHYDLSNEFYQLFLDPDLVYSCALWRHPDETLEQAQLNKLNALIGMAGIKAGDHVLEIGSGWGAFAMQAVRATGCRVTTITISKQQYELARQRIRAAGLEDRIDVQLCDYRHVQGQYDRVVSIEMAEAVGHEFLDDYFAAIQGALKPGGTATIQVITIPDTLYANYLKTADWIRKHIFPGGHLPSPSALRDAIAQSTQLAIQRSDSIGIHYARTLRMWRERFVPQRNKVAALGFDETFRRKWIYYLAYCEAAFATRTLDTVQMVLGPKTPAR